MLKIVCCICNKNSEEQVDTKTPKGWYYIQHTNQKAKIGDMCCSQGCMMQRFMFLVCKENYEFIDLSFM